MTSADTSLISHPVVAEILRDHKLMRIVIRAMEAECDRTMRGMPLRPEAWHAIVDFNGNFVHLCHRVKEDEHLVPALVAHGLIDAKAQLENQQQHQQAAKLTLDIIAGYEEGDWEKVHRLSMKYAQFLLEHMQHEEEWLLKLANCECEPELSAAIDRVNRSVMGEAGFERYVKVAQSLCSLTEIDFEF